MKVHLTFSKMVSPKQDPKVATVKEDERLFVGATMEGDAVLIREIIELAEQAEFTIR